MKKIRPAHYLRVEINSELNWSGLILIKSGFKDVNIYRIKIVQIKTVWFT